MGPILFNLYTSKFPSCVQSCTPHLYADDCQLHLSYDPDQIQDAILQINSDLKNILTWSTENGLKLNIGKCSVLHLAPQDRIQTLSENGVEVTLGGKSLATCNKV
ncbi:reverse transcriptase domain-containing protein, partial [Klebsiella pneumoniae]|uniref:reverse transcriptase domain-containing protein n=1 Tax=Klebsiella pneumoniae TaxID=573 RepID=UPI0034D29ACA